MKTKTKVILHAPYIAMSNRKARKLAKKSARPGNEEKYPLQWKNDFVIKKARKVLKIFKVELVVNGYDNIPKQPAILAPNHSSAMDPAIVMAALKNPGETTDDRNHKAIFIAKAELKKNKKLKGYAALVDSFFIDRKKPRDAIKILDDAAKEAKDSKRHLIIFPEGTRSKDGQLLDFKGGAFKIAKQAFLPVVPVTINNSLSATNLERMDKLKITITFHKQLKPMSFLSTDTKSIGERVKKIVSSVLEKPEGTRAKSEDTVAN